MNDVTLQQVVWLLAAAAVAAPLAKALRIGSVLGYLLAGILIGPFGFSQIFTDYTAEQLLHAAESGVVLLLFLIGLELRPRRLMAMRNAIFGLGGSQLLITGLVLAVVGIGLGLSPVPALFIGFVLALSSTAFALQMLEEKGELTARHGRLAFAVLLFQDLAAIPLIALAPAFALAEIGNAPKMDAIAAVRALATIVLVVAVGHFVLDRVLRLIARTQVREAMTAAALLTVVGTSFVMVQAGLSPSLGAFLAGALLAESSYRHQLEADIQPFQGLLLGVFFTAVGMTLNLEVLLLAPGLIIALVVCLVTIKSTILYMLGRWQGLEQWAARRLGLSLSQGGEFAFVLLTAGTAAGAIAQDHSEALAVVVTLSMALTPLLLLVDEAIGRPKPAVQPVAAMPEEEGHVIIAGFGRYGQIAARVLLAKRIQITALDINPEQIATLERFGSKAFYGDASRLEVLEAASAGKARALVLAIDDVETSLRAAAVVRAHYPDLPVFARARNRNHVHRLMDLDIKVIRRETFLSALDLTRELLREFGLSEREVRFTLDTFARQDEQRLTEDYKHYTDEQKLVERARSDAETLAELFDEDVAAQAAADEVPVKRSDATKVGAKPASKKETLA